ncbi:MAG TPA: alpha/beta hydrolase-fold protein [Candidatus Eisenbacteria bacterium]|nr:alpha/beta hydrolase-fold protein [Candidatus Eisenbacteria bacterium]
MTLAIAELMAGGPPSPEAIDRFLTSHSFPLVEGPSVTFVYRGQADAVNLKHMVYGLPSMQPFRRLEGTDLWHLVLELPERSRVEYKLEVVANGTGMWIEDPLNPHRSRDPFGTNSVAHGAGYAVPEWTLEDPDARRGTLREAVIPSAALGRDAHVTLYLPARLRPTRRYPLLVVHDGGDYLHYASIQTVLDNLIHRLEMAETVVALSHPVERLAEYPNNPDHARFMAEELVPWLESELPLQGTPEGRCLMGASFGAVASLSTAWRYPGMFGRLLLQSGSFAFTDIGRSERGPAFEPVVRFVNEFRSRPAAVSERLFVSCGVYESLIYENRSLVPLLQSTGMEVRYVEARDGHNWENWRDRLRDGLSWLLPGPLWMIYE